MSARRLQLVALALVLAPGVARACAVCGGGNPANRFAFFASTIALSLLPLGMFTGGALWVRTRLRDRLLDEFTERDAVPSTGAPVAPATPGPPETIVPVVGAPPSR